MRKRLISPIRKTNVGFDRAWLELERVAVVEVSSEADAYPIEGALVYSGQRGWRAAVPGVQTIRLLFDEPQTIQRVQLVFKEEEVPRTQEFVLRWLPHGGGAWKDVLRQQWNFSPPDTVEECEDYNLQLSGVAALELTMNPDIGRRESYASLDSLKLQGRDIL